MEGLDSTDLAQDRDRWWSLVNTVSKFVSYKIGEFFDLPMGCQLLKQDSTAWSQRISYEVRM